MILSEQRVFFSEQKCEVDIILHRQHKVGLSGCFSSAVPASSSQCLLAALTLKTFKYIHTQAKITEARKDQLLISGALAL